MALLSFYEGAVKTEYGLKALVGLYSTAVQPTKHKCVLKKRSIHKGCWVEIHSVKRVLISCCRQCVTFSVARVSGITDCRHPGLKKYTQIWWLITFFPICLEMQNSEGKTHSVIQIKKTFCSEYFHLNIFICFAVVRNYCLPWVNITYARTMECWIEPEFALCQSRAESCVSGPVLRFCSYRFQECANRIRCYKPALHSELISGGSVSWNRISWESTDPSSTK